MAIFPPHHIASGNFVGGLLFYAVATVFQLYKAKNNIHVCVLQVSGLKILGMFGRNNILFCQNILFSRRCQN